MSSRKEKMKVYHGIPKSVTDESTIFYASLDGSAVPKIGRLNTSSKGISFNKSPNGLGISAGSLSLSLKDIIKDIITLDFYVGAFPKVTGGNKQSIGFKNSQENTIFNLEIPNDKNYLALVNASNSGWVRTSIPGDNTFVRVILSDTVLKIFNNGILAFEGNSYIENIKDITSLNINVAYTGVVSDIHISNVDRGDVFPTLPQDFIDGKAIIVPPLGQQQIVGDPMYSQVTELRCKYSDKTSDGLYGLETVDDCVQSLTDPEFWTSNSKWETSAKFKIKGLNGEIISGVIDSDTALTKITRIAKSPVTVIECNDVSKFSVGDTIVVVDLTDNNCTYPSTITNINATTREITLDKVLNSSEGPWRVGDTSHYIYETTTSSSSPVVKSVDGTNVVGTWSGLGTNEATFTLGTNTPSLTGKDLHVTYSLNMPSGNSCFPELPYSVDKAYNEVGLEMKPVSEIVIEDDFRGKISGSTKECSHKLSYNITSTVPALPTGSYIEYSTSNYNLVVAPDSATLSEATSTNLMVPTHMYSFDLIKIIESKLGEIPSPNKIQWLKANVSIISCTVVGSCANPSNNEITLKVLFSDTNTWSQGSTKSAPALQVLTNNTTDYNILSRIIPSSGIVNYVLCTDPSNGTVPSRLVTDYVKISVGLKIDPTYTTLYCDNKRAREDSCNPVLIQKETKTVKRYLPSKENFVTECKHACTNGLATLDTKPVLHPSERVCDSYFLANSTYGTDGLDREGDNPSLRGSLAYLKPSKTLHMYTAEPMIISDGNFAPNERYLHRYIQEPNGYSADDNGARTMFDTSKYIAKNFVTAKPFLINQSGELKMYVYKSDFANKFYTGENMHIFDLPNRPLIL